MSDREVLEADSPKAGEQRSIEFGDVLTAPYGQAVVGLAMSIYGGLLASFITVAVTTNLFVGVAGIVGLIYLLLGVLWIVEFRLRRRSAARIGLPLAGAATVTVAGTVAVKVDAGEPWAIVLGGGLIVIGAFSVADRFIDSAPDAPDSTMRSQLIAFYNGGPPRWARDLQTEISTLRDDLAATAPPRPPIDATVVRTSSLSAWWRLRPRWKGPTS